MGNRIFLDKPRSCLKTSMVKLGMYADLESQNFRKNLQLEGKVNYYISPYNKEDLKKCYMRFDEEDNNGRDTPVYDNVDNKLKTTHCWKKISDFVLYEENSNFQ
jgi:hypothetical protein